MSYFIYPNFGSSFLFSEQLLHTTLPVSNGVNASVRSSDKDTLWWNGGKVSLPQLRQWFFGRKMENDFPHSSHSLTELAFLRPGTAYTPPGPRFIVAKKRKAMESAREKVLPVLCSGVASSHCGWESKNLTQKKSLTKGSFYIIESNECRRKENGMWYVCHSQPQYPL